MANEKRLIDANKIKYHQEKVCYGHGCFRTEETVSREEIDRIPTADAVEVVHGRWEFSHTTSDGKFDIVKCSNCGHNAFGIAIYVTEGHYCPSCGAKMDGDGNEN